MSRRDTAAPGPAPASPAVRRMRHAVTARWVLTGFDGGVPRLVPDATVVVEGGRVADVTTAPVRDAVHRRLPGDCLVMPGLIDLHCHTLNGPLFRGVTEDRPRTTQDGTLVYDVLMPVGDLAGRLLDEEQAGAVYSTGLLSALRGGTTTVVDVFRPSHAALLSAARAVGLRLFAAPYVASRRITGTDPDGQPRTEPTDPHPALAQTLALHSAHDDGPDGLLRIGFGPHCTDTCSPALLHAITEAARDRDMFVTIHVAQTRPEVRFIRRTYDRTPVQYLVDHGVGGPGVIAAHCAHADDDDLRLLADTGTAVACCPATFVHSGVPLDYRRFLDAAVPTGIGTDGHSVRLTDELRVAGMLAKSRARAADVGTAADLLRTATERSASALGRSDLGHLRRGARADLVAFRLGDGGARPVLDPLTTLVWHPAAVHTDLVMVDGTVLIEGGRSTTHDAARIERRSADVVRGLWEAAGAEGLTAPAGVRTALDDEGAVDA